MSHLSFSNKRKIYLLDFSSPSEINLPRLAKFLIQQIRYAFQQAAYNDQITGLLYNFDCEEVVKAQLTRNECYVELLVPAEAIAEITPDGQVFIASGFDPKVLSVKTLDRVYRYDTETNSFAPPSSLHTFSSTHKKYKKYTIRKATQKVYNYSPEKWKALINNQVLAGQT